MTKPARRTTVYASGLGLFDFHVLRQHLGDWFNLGEVTPVGFIDTCYHALSRPPVQGASLGADVVHADSPAWMSGPPAHLKVRV